LKFVKVRLVPLTTVTFWEGTCVQLLEPLRQKKTLVRAASKLVPLIVPVKAILVRGTVGVRM
jgi:hypothetical protein